MGEKVNPIGMRLQDTRTWDSRWYADDKDYGNLLLEDLKIRDFIHKEAKQAGVSRVIIERPHKKCRVTFYAARPGVIIGKKGADIETLRKKLSSAAAARIKGFLSILFFLNIFSSADFLIVFAAGAVPILAVSAPGIQLKPQTCMLRYKQMKINNKKG